MKTLLIFPLLALALCGCPEHTATHLEISGHHAEPTAGQVVASRGRKLRCTGPRHASRPAPHTRPRA